MRTAIVVVLGVAAAAVAQQAQKAQGELPLKHVVLFTSGVGYFEHGATLEGPADFTLRFRGQQINDLLKSLILIGGQGETPTVTYGSQEPLDRALASFGINIADNPPLPQLLNRLRGARVAVRAPEEVAGAIVNVQERTIQLPDDGGTGSQYFLTLMTDAGLRSMSLDSVQSVQLAEPKLQDELSRALALVAEARDAETKPVSIHFPGAGRRDVRVGYLLESPMWKSSYRLDLSGKEPFLQAWAIVENTSNSDWNDVRLSLVAGRPISFVQDLYTPLFVPRPVVTPPSYAQLRPQRYEEGMSLDAAAGEQAMVGQRMRAMKSQADRAPMPAMAMAEAAAAPPPLELRGGAMAVASGQALGELFQFTVQQPVSIPRRQSAMLPIVSQTVQAERVSVYNQNVLAKHPLNGARLKNTTDLSLLAGPVTVLDGGAYAGDAQLDDLPAGDSRLLTYAVDLEVTVDPSQKSESRLVDARIVRGVLELKRSVQQQQTYAIKNDAADDKRLIVEQPYAPQWELLEPAQYLEKTPQVYRFDVPVKGRKTQKFEVRQQQVLTQAVALLDASPDAFLLYVREGKISSAVRDALEKAAQMKRKLASLQEQLGQAESELAQIQQGQERLRQNLNSVGAGSQLGQRYLQKLAQEEDQIEKLQARVQELRGQVKTQSDELAAYLANLNVGG